MDTLLVCELCRRKGFDKLTEHHLIPREEGGTHGEVTMICQDCHKQIHAIYTNKELAIRLNTLMALIEDDNISKYLKYIRKQPSSKLVRVKKSREVRRK